MCIINVIVRNRAISPWHKQHRSFHFTKESQPFPLDVDADNETTTEFHQRESTQSKERATSLPQKQRSIIKHDDSPDIERDEGDYSYGTETANGLTWQSTNDASAAAVSPTRSTLS